MKVKKCYNFTIALFLLISRDIRNRESRDDELRPSKFPPILCVSPKKVTTRKELLARFEQEGLEILEFCGEKSGFSIIFCIWGFWLDFEINSKIRDKSRIFNVSLSHLCMNSSSKLLEYGYDCVFRVSTWNSLKILGK